MDVGLLSAYAGIASGVGMVAFGLLAFAGGRTRVRGAFIFGFFALLWGVQIAFANFASIAETQRQADLFYVAQTALLLPLPYLLVSFVASQSLTRGRLPWMALQAVLLAFALAALALMYLDINSLYGGSTLLSGVFTPAWGPWLAPLVGIPFYAALMFAIIGLRRIEEKAPTPRLARRANFVSLGLALFTSYASGVYLIFFGFFSMQTAGLADILFTAFYALSSVVVVTLGIRSLMADPTRVRYRIRTGLIHLLPWAAGILEGILIVSESRFGLHTAGLWRLGSIAIIAFGLANWRTFDLPQRTARSTATAAGVTGSMAGGVATFSVSLAMALSLSVAIGVGTVFAAATVAPLVRLAKRLIPQRFQLQGNAVSEALYGQKIDAYRAALEASLARGTFTEDQDFLSALKERFGITDDEERLLLHLAQNSVLVPNKEDPDTVYEKLRLLGEGGSGRTWLVRDRVRERLVVLKEPLERWQTEPSLRERVLREARLAAKVRHPNVVRIEEVVEAKGHPNIVMEHVDGGTLRDLLRDQGVLPWRQTVSIMEDVLNGLDAVHSTGIVHRDIKPSNILLTSDGTAKVSDFGIAIPATSTRTLIDPLDAMAGTRAYMAPETLMGRSTGTRQSDVYSCAVVLYECLYGTPPAPNAVVFAQKDIPDGLIAAIERGLAANPKDRHGSVRAFADALRRVTGT